MPETVPQEMPSNPLVKVTFEFKDGATLMLPIQDKPQFEAMKALGRLAAMLGADPKNVEPGVTGA